MTKFKVVKSYTLEVEAEDMLTALQMVINEELDFSQAEELLNVTKA